MTEPNLDETLQRYFDGDLPPAEADALRARLDGDAELRAKLAGLEQLRTLLRAALAPEHVEAPDAEAMFAKIQASITEAPAAAAASPPGLRVLPGGKQDEASAPAAPASRVPVWLGLAAIGLAAAAALYLFVLRPSETATTEGPVTPIAAAPPPGSEIEAVDFGHSTGAIFQVEDQGAAYAVVWISDEKPEGEGEEGPDAPEDRIQ